MDKTGIRERAITRMRFIEERFTDHVPVEAQSYWRLCYLIADGFRSYFESYGLLPVDAEDAEAGRSLMRWGPLSHFERDVLRLLAIRIGEEATSNSNRKRISLVD